MFKHTSLLVCAVLFGILLLCGCDTKKGACIKTIGLSQGCSDDSTEYDCNSIGGESWHEGKTCDELGFRKATASVVALSEFYIPRSGSGFGWVEILNASDESVNLSGFSLALGNVDGKLVHVALDGIIEGCGTFIAGGPNVEPGEGQPRLDQTVDIESGLSLGGSNVVYVALLGPEEGSQRGTPLSSIVVDHGPNQVQVSHGKDCATILGIPRAGTSIERAAWPADIWYGGTRPSPNSALSVLGCNELPGGSRSWQPLSVGF